MRTIWYLPNQKKEYTDDNICEAVRFYLQQVHGYDHLMLRFAWDEDSPGKALFYIWMELTQYGCTGRLPGIIILPTYNPYEIEKAQTEGRRLKRLLSRRFPDLKVQSSLRLHPGQVLLAKRYYKNHPASMSQG